MTWSYVIYSTWDHSVLRYYRVFILWTYSNMHVIHCCSAAVRKPHTKRQADRVKSLHQRKCDAGPPFAIPLTYVMQDDVVGLKGSGDHPEGCLRTVLREHQEEIQCDAVTSSDGLDLWVQGCKVTFNATSRAGQHEVIWDEEGMYTMSTPDSKVHGANMGPISDRQDPGGTHVGHMNFAIWDECQMNAFRNTLLVTLSSTYTNSIFAMIMVFSVI